MQVFLFLFQDQQSMSNHFLNESLSFVDQLQICSIDGSGPSFAKLTPFAKVTLFNSLPHFSTHVISDIYMLHTRNSYNSHQLPLSDPDRIQLQHHQGGYGGLDWTGLKAYNPQSIEATATNLVSLERQKTALSNAAMEIFQGGL